MAHWLFVKNQQIFERRPWYFNINHKGSLFVIVHVIVCTIRSSIGHQGVQARETCSNAFFPVALDKPSISFLTNQVEPFYAFIDCALVVISKTRWSIGTYYRLSGQATVALILLV